VGIVRLVRGCARRWRSERDSKVKILRFDAGSGPRYGELAGDTVWEWEGGLFDAPRRTGASWAATAVRILPPVVPSKFVLASKNYEESLVANKLPRPKNPLLFLKAPSAIVADGAAIVYPSEARYVTFEPELVVVIGRECSRVAPAQALQHVLGYTCTNDVSARDIQQEEIQFTRCKSFDTFGPLGPAIVTGVDPSDLRVTGYVNGERRTERRTRTFLFDVPTLVSFASHCMTLFPGDLVSTGAGGVGEIHPGDEVVVDIENVGRLTNRVIRSQ